MSLSLLSSPSSPFLHFNKKPIKFTGLLNSDFSQRITTTGYTGYVILQTVNGNPGFPYIYTGDPNATTISNWDIAASSVSNVNNAYFVMDLKGDTNGVRWEVKSANMEITFTQQITIPAGTYTAGFTAGGIGGAGGANAYTTFKFSIDANTINLVNNAGAQSNSFTNYSYTNLNVSSIQKSFKITLKYTSPTPYDSNYIYFGKIVLTKTG